MQMLMAEDFSEAFFEGENMKTRKYVEVKLKRGRHISPQMQQDLLRFYGFKVVTGSKGRMKEEN